MGRPRRSTRPRRRGRGPHSKADNDYRSGRYVCISMRRYNTETGVMEHCGGCNVRAFDFEPKELQAIIIRALQATAAEHQAIKKGELDDVLLRSADVLRADARGDQGTAGTPALQRRFGD